MIIIFILEIVWILTSIFYTKHGEANGSPTGSTMTWTSLRTPLSTTSATGLYIEFSFTKLSVCATVQCASAYQLCRLGVIQEEKSPFWKKTQLFGHFGHVGKNLVTPLRNWSLHFFLSWMCIYMHLSASAYQAWRSDVIQERRSAKGVSPFWKGSAKKIWNVVKQCLEKNEGNYLKQ